MAHTRPILPEGHGELLAEPAVAEWPALARAGAKNASGWRFDICGQPVQAFRSKARAEAVAAASEFSARLGVPVSSASPPERPVIMTGHQPELFHPGVWVKEFLLERVAREAEATAIDLVVDSDDFESVKLSAPCLEPEISRCERVLSRGAADSCYACTAVPTVDEIDAFCAAGDDVLATLKAPSVRRHFAEYGDCLREAVVSAQNLAELMVFARRRYEATAGTSYLELPVTALAKTGSYSRFVAHVALHAARFAADYNNELDEYRVSAKIRSAAQPFPDLALTDDCVELPFWHLGPGSRRTLWAVTDAKGIRLEAGGTTVTQFPRDCERAWRALADVRSVIAPKALALTLYARVFLSDLFIHGVGGAHYDHVTDGVAKRFFGVLPPPFAVASLTVYLPVGGHLVSEVDVRTATERLNRFEHNPDAMLDEVEFDSDEERRRARALADEKARLVVEIGRPGANKKLLGGQIRETNSQLRDLLAPVEKQLRSELGRLERERAAAEVLTDRSYPFCLWSPAEIADKAE